MTDLASLGLIPPQKHPDALLLAMIANERLLCASLGERCSLRNALEHQKLEDAVVATPAVTVFGLLEKAERVLEIWSNGGGPEGEALDAPCALIVEMIAVLSLFTEREIAERRART